MVCLIICSMGIVYCFGDELRLGKTCASLLMYVSKVLLAVSAVISLCEKATKNKIR